MLAQIENKIDDNARIDAVEAAYLIKHAGLLTLGEWADLVRHRLHPDPVVTFVSDRNINYTNICASGCRFCAFFRAPGQVGGYVLDRETLAGKIRETLDLGGTQILLQGGMNPELKLKDYIDLLQYIRSTFSVHIHGFSPPEIIYIADQSGLSVAEVLRRFIDAGLGSIPGGGAEILVDDVRKALSPNKCTSEQWLDVMRTAHQLGLRSTATMMFGHIETTEQIVEHLMKIRSLQDETGGFTAFIPWTFQPANTRIDDIRPAGAVAYLKVLAVSRIVLDNVPNIQASWVTQGDKIAQLALAFGANDFGSTMIEENVVAAAGVKFRLPKSQIIRLIEDAGFQAVQRDCFYNAIHSDR